MTEDDVKAEATARRAALIKAGLYIESPAQIDGLTYPIPPNRDLIGLQVSYDTKDSTGEKVRCSVCPTHTWHYRGFVGQLDDDSLALIGINCGENHFGEGKWGELRASLEARQNDAHYRARIEPAIKQIAVVYPMMADVSTAIGNWWDFKDRLSRDHRQFALELRGAAIRADGELTRDKTVMVTVVDQQGSERQEPQVQPERYGRIPFADGFKDDHVSRPVYNATEGLKAANRLLSEDATTKQLTEAFRALREGRRAIEDAQVFFEGCNRNLSPSWWERACNWYNSGDGDGMLKTMNNRLVRRDAEGTIASTRIPDAPTDAPFNAILNAWPR